IVFVGGTLALALGFGRLVGDQRVAGATDEVRRALREGLAGIDDASIDAYPDTLGEIEAVAAQAVEGRGRVVGSRRPERGSGMRTDMVVVAVEVRWAWEARCVRAELRGQGRVLTHVNGRRC